MPRAIWSGSLSFGLVNVPVRLYAATDSHQLEFHQFDSKTGKRIRYKRVVEGTNHEVAYDQIVDGYEVRKGKVVTLTDEEMSAAEPKKTRTLDIEDFVPLEDIDPVTWSHTYYVGPERNAGGQKAFAVLRDAMKQTGRVGVGRFVMRTKEYLAIIRPFGKAMALETMFFEDEIRDIKEIPEVASQPSVSSRELDMAKKLIESLSGAWKHGKYKDSYRDQLMQVINQKAKGATIDLPTSDDEGGKVIDLMEALKKSLAGGAGASFKGQRSKAQAPKARGSTGGRRGKASRPAAAPASKGGPRLKGLRAKKASSAGGRRAA